MAGGKCLFLYVSCRISLPPSLSCLHSLPLSLPLSLSVSPSLLFSLSLNPPGSSITFTVVVDVAETKSREESLADNLCFQPSRESPLRKEAHSLQTAGNGDGTWERTGREKNIITRLKGYPDTIRIIAIISASVYSIARDPVSLCARRCLLRCSGPHRGWVPALTGFPARRSQTIHSQAEKQGSFHALQRTGRSGAQSW